MISRPTAAEVTPASARKNLTAAITNQAVNAAAPLILIPLLVRSLGLEAFGSMALYLSIATYCLIVAEYSFNLSFVLKAGEHRSDPKRLGDLYANIVACRVLLALLALSLAAVAFWLLPVLQDGWMFFGAIALFALGAALNPHPVFRSIENLWPMVACNIAGRACSLLLILLLVTGPEDAALACLAFLIYLPIQAAAGSVWLLGARAITVPRRLAMRTVFGEIRAGFPLFMSFAGSSLLANSIPIILAGLASREAVGQFAAAERLIRGLLALIAPVDQALLPRVVAARRTSPRHAVDLALSWYFRLALFFLLAAAVVASGAEHWTRLFYGDHSAGVGEVLTALSMLPVLSATNQLIGTHILLVAGRERLHWRVNLMGGLACVVCASMATLAFPASSAVAAALALMIVEVCMGSTFITFAARSLPEFRRAALAPLARLAGK